MKPAASGESEPIIFKETPWFTSYGIYFGLSETGHLEGYVGEEWELEKTVDPTKLQKGAWSHVALTFDGSQLRLYVNGGLVSTHAAEGAGSSTGPLSIGCAREWGDGFKGAIDEVGIYDRALSAAEVTAGMTEPTGTPRAPVAAWSFDEGSGTTAHDATGDGHEGTVEGPKWTAGKFGSGLEFDGEASDCVSVPNSAQLQLGGDFTLEAWVKPAASGESEPIIFKETPWFTSYGIYFGLSETGHLEGYVGEEWELEKTVDPTKLQKGAWSHVALTFDGSQLRLYVNGGLVSTHAAEGAGSSTGPLSIGCAREWGDGFKGAIDEVGIYDRALSAEEVASDEGRPIDQGEGGDVYVAESGRVEEFSSAGEFIRQIGSQGTGNGQFDELSAITVDANGDLWALDRGGAAGSQGNAYRVQIFSGEGTYVGNFEYPYGSGTSQLSEPKDLAVDGGDLWVADTGNDRVVEFSRSTGARVRQLGTTGSGQGQLSDLEGSRSTARGTSGSPTPATTGSRSSRRRAGGWRSTAGREPKNPRSPRRGRCRRTRPGGCGSRRRAPTGSRSGRRSPPRLPRRSKERPRSNWNPPPRA